MFPLFLLCVPDSRLIPSVRASINVVSITAAAASLSSSSHCQSAGGSGRGGKVVGEETGGGRRGVGGKGTKRHLDDEVKPLGQSFLSISRGQSVPLVGYKKRRALPSLAKLPESSP